MRNSNSITASATTVLSWNLWMIYCLIFPGNNLIMELSAGQILFSCILFTYSFHCLSLFICSLYKIEY